MGLSCLYSVSICGRGHADVLEGQRLGLGATVLALVLWINSWSKNRVRVAGARSQSPRSYQESGLYSFNEGIPLRGGDLMEGNEPSHGPAVSPGWNLPRGL